MNQNENHTGYTRSIGTFTKQSTKSRDDDIAVFTGRQQFAIQVSCLGYGEGVHVSVCLSVTANCL